eukprot:gene27559-36355_t
MITITGSNTKLTSMNGTIRKLATSIFSRPIITSETNEKVKFIRSLTQRKKRDASGTVLLEGFRQVDDAFKFGIVAKYVLVSERVVESSAAKSLINTYLSSNCEFADVVSNSVMASLSETVNSQGIVAAFYKPSPQKSICLPLDKDNCSRVFGPGPVVVLDRLADPGNVGTIIRSCFGFGVNSVVTVSGGCDIWSPKVLRSAMGLCVNPAMPILELASWTDISQTLRDYADRLQQDGKGESLQVLVADGGDENLSYDEVDYLRPSVIIVGSEAHGPSPEALQMSFTTVIKIRIPMTRKLESFNAAVAVSVILGEAARQRNAASRIQRSTTS